MNNNFSSIPYPIAAPSMIVPQLYQPPVIPSIPIVAPVVPPVQVPISPISSVPAAGKHPIEIFLSNTVLTRETNDVF